MCIPRYDHKEGEMSARRRPIEERYIDGFVRDVRSHWRRLANDRARATLTLLSYRSLVNLFERNERTQMSNILNDSI